MTHSHTSHKIVPRRIHYRCRLEDARHDALASVASVTVLSTPNEVDPDDKPMPNPDIPPPSRPAPGTPKPGDPPGRPRPADPPPAKPQPDSPRPVRPKSIYLYVILVLSILGVFITSGAAAEQIDDDDILEAIAAELRYDEAVSSDLLDVKVNAGIVNLSGSHFTLLAKRRASRLIGSLKGVRAIIDRTTVLPDGRADKRIATDVRRTLQDDPATNEHDIHIEVADGRVTLTGNVDSFAESQLAEQSIAGVRDVAAIDNQLRISESAARPDSEIGNDIRRRFELNPFLAEGLIELEVKDANVTLRGVVGSANEKQLAEMLAYVRGVRDVDAKSLDVKWWLDRKRRRGALQAVRNDVDIQRAVRDALLYDPRVKGADITVRVRQAAVTLLGNVGSLSAKRAAERDALNTLGVRRVINHLKVKVRDWPGDLAVTEQAQQTLARDAHLFDSTLRASSHFGKVYLSGTVATHFEKQRAEEVIANVPGALGVVNRLVVDAQWQPKPDGEIREDTTRRLHWSPIFEDGQIEVRVDDGVTTLRGAVDTWQERRQAEHYAFQGGARRVANKLAVRSDSNTNADLKALPSL